MKRLFLLLALLFPALAFAQGSNYQAILLGSTGRPTAGAQITVCAAGALGVPCSPTVNIYKDQALTIPQSNPIITDSLGNFSFWAAPNTYLYTATGLNVTSHGPFVIVLPCIVGASCAAAGGLPVSNVAFSATPSFAVSSNASYFMPMQGNVTAITLTGTPVNGNLLQLHFTQQAGGFTVTWPANFIFASDFAFKTQPLAQNNMLFVFDGVNWSLVENIPDGALDYYPAPTFTATPTFSNTRSAAFDFTLTGNVTASTFTTTGRAGTIFNLNACEDGVGGRTFAFPVNVTNPPGFTFDTVATHCNYLTYRFNGTTWTPISTGGSGGGGSPGGVSGDVQINSGGFGAGGQNDNGTRLAIDRDVNPKGPNPYFDIMRYGGYVANTTSLQTMSCSITAASTTLSCASNPDFINGHGVMIPLAGAGPTDIPTAPAVGTVTPIGVANGSTTYQYKFVLENYSGALTAAGTQGQTTTGAATLGVNSVSLSGVVRTSELETYTCTTNCNLQAGAQAQISGAVNTSINGTVIVNSVPTSTTFTVLANGMPDYTESFSGTLAVRACNMVFPSGALAIESKILRTWIYRGGTLVGVSPGQDPFFIDCNQGVTAPSYVPTSVPGSSQVGYLSATISSGGGTNTMTLSTTATTTASSVTVQHDNTPNLIAAWTAAYTAHGGIVRIPVIPNNSFNTFPFNSTINLAAIANPTASAVKLQVARMTNSQPLILPANTEGEGIPQTSSTSQYSTLGVIDGTAHPLILGNINTSGDKLTNIKLAVGATGQSSVVLDEVIGAGGVLGFVFERTSLSGNNASAVVAKGGSDFWFPYSTCSVGGSEGGLWYSHPCVEFTGASTYVNASTSQVPSRIYMEKMNFIGGTSVQFDNFPFSNQASNFSNCGNNIVMNGTVHKTNAGPPLRIACGLSNGAGIALTNLVIPDTAVGVHQPFLEMGLSIRWNVITLENNARTTGGNGPTMLGGSSFAAPVCINNFTSGCGPASSYNINGANTTVHGGVVGADTGGSMGYLMSTPVAPTSCVVSAGGAVSIGAHTYSIAAVDRSNFTTSPYAGLTILGLPCTATTSSGQQTVTVTRPTLPVGATGWVVWRETALASLPISCSIPIPANITTFVDTSASACGDSPPSFTTAFTSGINSQGTTSANAFMSGWAMGQRTLTSGVTLGKNDATVYANTSGGSFTITLNHALVGEIWVVYNLSTGANVLTIQPDSGTLDGASSTTIANGNGKLFTCDGTNCQTIGSTGGSGSGNVANALQYSTPYYSASGTANNISGVSPSTSNGLYVSVHNVTAAAAVPPSDALLGIPVNVQTGNYTLAYSDRASFLIFQSCTTPTLTLPAITGNLASNLPFRVLNLCSGNLTITATTPNTIDGGSAGGSVTVFPGWTFFLTQDGTPNWFTTRLADLRAFATGCTALTFNSSTGLICATLPTVSGVNAQTTNYTAVAGDNGKIVSMNGASVTLTLPASPPASPWGIFVENVNASALTVSRNGLNIDGAASNLSLTQNQGVWITHDGSNYFTSRGVGGAGGGGGTPCIATSLSLQYNNGGAFGCVTEFTYTASTITGSASAKLDLSAANPVNAFKVPIAANAAPITASLVGYDSTKNELVYGNGVLTMPAGVISQSDYFQQEEWTGSAVAGNLQGWQCGVGTCNDFSAVAGHYGVISVETGTTISTIVRFGERGTGNNGDVYPDIHTTVWINRWVAKLAGAACVGEACTINAKYRLGIMDTWGTDPPSSGYYFEAVEGATNNSNIKCVTNNAGTATSTDSGVALDTNWHAFAIFNDGSGSSTKFYIDGVLKCTNTTNLPTVSPIFPDLQIVNTSANSKVTDLDYWSMYIATPR